MDASEEIKIELRLTEDGSHTLHAAMVDECYHSTHGAIQESMHIFIDAGLRLMHKKELTIFEVGFGTGLNAFLAAQFAEQNQCDIRYISIEKYPVPVADAQKLNYADCIDPAQRTFFETMHQCRWNESYRLSPHFELKKIKGDFTSYLHTDTYDLVFFDAFSPEKQPEMWTAEVFGELYRHCHSGAILTTYCAKGAVKRNLLSAGFRVEKVPGPPGKREFLRGVKNEN
jgi:tRNA U34 5-methylaminomethyl-2-thiouridine-forming methyltransferase MnmC